MRQKEKRRLRRFIQTAAERIALAIRQRTPGSPDFVEVCSAECLICGCEFDPDLHKRCPACRA